MSGESRKRGLDDYPSLAADQERAKIRRDGQLFFETEPFTHIDDVILELLSIECYMGQVKSDAFRKILERLEKSDNLVRRKKGQDIAAYPEKRFIYMEDITELRSLVDEHVSKSGRAKFEEQLEKLGSDDRLIRRQTNNRQPLSETEPFDLIDDVILELRSIERYMGQVKSNAFRKILERLDKSYNLVRWKQGRHVPADPEELHFIYLEDIAELRRLADEYMSKSGRAKLEDQLEKMGSEDRLVRKQTNNIQAVVPSDHAQPTPRSGFNDNRNLRLDDFEFVRNLRRFGFVTNRSESNRQTVRLAKYKHSGLLVVLKVYSKARLKILGAEAKANREMELHRRLRHQHILPQIGCFLEADCVYVILEYAERGNIYNYIMSRTNGRLTEIESAHYVRQLVSALSYCHPLIISHRDISTMNMYMGASYNLLLDGFGRSMMVDPQSDFMRANSQQFSNCAPELTESRSHDEKVDVYAVGVVLYEMMTGTLPFNCQNPSCTGIFQVPSYVSAGAKDLLMKLIVVDPTKRLSIREILNHSWVVQPMGSSEDDEFDSSSVLVTCVPPIATSTASSRVPQLPASSEAVNKSVDTTVHVDAPVNMEGSTSANKGSSSVRPPAMTTRQKATTGTTTNVQ